jgi:hypothetical protein
MRLRNFFIILVSLLLLAALGLAAYYIIQGGTGTTPTTGGNFFSNLFPFGNETVPEETEEEEEVVTPAPTGERYTLRQLSTAPVAGVIVYTQGSDTVVRYVERATGHVYDIAATGGSAKRVSNTTVPKVYEARWLPSARTAILRYLDSDGESIVSYAALLRSSGSEESRFEGTFLPRNLKDLALSPGGRIAYLTKTSSGGTITAADPDGRRSQVLVTLPFSSWLLSWPATSTIAVTTTPSARAFGFLYFLNTTSSRLTKVLGDVPGLTATVNQPLTKVVYSESGERGITTKSLDIKSGAVTELPLQTLPAEKCVWSATRSITLYCAAPFDIPPGDYPDLWYQGLVSFSDNLWELDLESGSATLLSLLSEEEGGMDATGLRLSPDESFLTFINKNDSSLWSLELR